MKISLRTIVVCVLAFAVGVYVGTTRDAAYYAVDNVNADMTVFAETWNLMETYFEGAEGFDRPTPEERVRGAVEGLVRSYGDPHSAFLGPDLAQQFEEDAQGNFGGVGMEIDVRNELLVVVAPLKGTPAEEAGLLPGDQIIGIDGATTIDMSVEEAVQIIRGEVGTDVTLTLYREDEGIFEVTITRGIIVIPTVEFEEVDEVFVIRIFNFSAHVADDFRNALEAYKESGLTDLVLDLRGNPGGFLDSAIDILSYLVPEGEVLVYEVSGVDEIVHRSKGYEIALPETNMVVLINAGSASAAEIVAGALQEYEIAALVGTQTFGKGSVQQVLRIQSDIESLLKLTVAQWYTPLRNSISQNGLTPDIEVELTFDDLEQGSDPQFDRALELLN